MNEAIDFLKFIKADKVEYEGRQVLAAVLNTSSLLRTWGCDSVISTAGLLSNIYGKHFGSPELLSLTRRAGLKKIVGPEIENLAYVFCSLRHDYFKILLKCNREIYTYKNRWTSKNTVIQKHVFMQLVLLEFAKKVESMLWRFKVTRALDLKAYVDEISFFEKSKPFVSSEIYDSVSPVWRLDKKLS